MDWLKPYLGNNSDTAPSLERNGREAPISPLAGRNNSVLSENAATTPPTGSHKYLVIVYGVGIGVLILAGAALVANKVPTNSASSSYTWGTEGGAGRFIPSESFGGSLRDAPALPERFTIADLYRSLESSPDRFFASFNTPNTPGGKSPNASTTAEGELQYDESGIDALLASLRPSSSIAAPSDDSGELEGIYNYIPTSIVGTSTDTKKPLTAAQRKLRNYGLEAGGPIETYATEWGSSQAQIFKGLFEDRSDTEKINAAKAAARALFDVGVSLEGISDVPASVKPQHDKLAASYKTVGRALIPLINAKTDADLLTQLSNYNAVVEQFAHDYLAVVAIFSANQITYEEGEPGRVFVFTPMTAASTGGF